MGDRIQVRVNGREAVFGTAVPEVAVGSDRSCLVRLHDQGVAGRHLLLRHEDGNWFVEALEPARVFVRGQRIERCKVNGPLDLRLADPDVGPLLVVTPAVEDGAGAPTRDWVTNRDVPGSDVRERPTTFLLPDSVLRIGRDL